MAVFSLIAIVVMQNVVAASVETSQTVAADPGVGAMLMGTVLALACVFFASVLIFFTIVAGVPTERRHAGG